MLLIDANVLIYSFRQDDPQHTPLHRWLREALVSEASVGISELGLAALVRVLTHPRLAVAGTGLDEALKYADWLRDHPHTVVLTPGAQHWGIFKQLCRTVAARGNLVMDAYLAALAIENSAELISTDGDFARFPGLRWRHPLKA